MASTHDTRTRRSALTTIAAAFLGLSLGSAAAADEPERQNAAQSTASASAPTPDQSNGPGRADAPTTRYEWFEATVDRIVDGQHVVVLLEADGRVVEQLVVDRPELPTVQERDRLLVLVDGDDLAAAVRL